MSGKEFDAKERFYGCDKECKLAARALQRAEVQLVRARKRMDLARVARGESFMHWQESRAQEQLRLEGGRGK